MGTKARNNNFIPKHIFLKGSVPSDFVPKRAFVRSAETQAEIKKEDQTVPCSIPLSVIHSPLGTFKPLSASCGTPEVSAGSVSSGALGVCPEIISPLTAMASKGSLPPGSLSPLAASSSLTSSASCVTPEVSAGSVSSRALGACPEIISPLTATASKGSLPPGSLSPLAASSSLPSSALTASAIPVASPLETGLTGISTSGSGLFSANITDSLHLSSQASLKRGGSTLPKQRNNSTAVAAVSLSPEAVEVEFDSTSADSLAKSPFSVSHRVSSVEEVSEEERAAILPFPSLARTSEVEQSSAADQTVAAKTDVEKFETAEKVDEGIHLADLETDESVLLPIKEQEKDLPAEELPSWLQPAFQFAARALPAELTDLSPEEEWLSHVLGRSLTARDRELFYWEDYVEPQNDQKEKNEEIKEIEILPKSKFLAACYSGVEYLGSCILTTWHSISRIFFSIPNKTTANEENNKAFPKKRKFYLSDMMISIVTGVCIATFIVFPLLRVVGEEVFYVVAKSVVRHMGEKVSLNAMGSDATLLPILSEQFIFPKMESSEGGAEVIEENETVIPLE